MSGGKLFANVNVKKSSLIHPNWPLQITVENMGWMRRFQCAFEALKCRISTWKSRRIMNLNIFIRTQLKRPKFSATQQLNQFLLCHRLDRSTKPFSQQESRKVERYTTCPLRKQPFSINFACSSATKNFRQRKIVGLVNQNLGCVLVLIIDPLNQKATVNSASNFINAKNTSDFCVDRCETIVPVGQIGFEI